MSEEPNDIKDNFPIGLIVREVASIHMTVGGVEACPFCPGTRFGDGAHEQPDRVAHQANCIVLLARDLIKRKSGTIEMDHVGKHWKGTVYEAKDESREDNHHN